jgi:hypothetical protein
MLLGPTSSVSFKPRYAESANAVTLNGTSKALASFKSVVARPSVNQLKIGARKLLVLSQLALIETALRTR